MLPADEVGDRDERLQRAVAGTCSLPGKGSVDIISKPEVSMRSDRAAAIDRDGYSRDPFARHHQIGFRCAASV